MKVTYDPEVDALTIILSDAAVEESDEAKPGVILDYDANGNIVGLFMPGKILQMAFNLLFGAFSRMYLVFLAFVAYDWFIYLKNKIGNSMGYIHSLHFIIQFQIKVQNEILPS